MSHVWVAGPADLAYPSAGGESLRVGWGLSVSALALLLVRLSLALDI